MLLALFGTALLVASQAWPHAGHKHEAEDPSIALPKVVAQVNGVDIPNTFVWSQLKQTVKRHKAKGHRLTQTQEKAEAKKLIEQEIRRELLLQRGKELGFSITTVMIEKKIEAVKSRFKSEAQFQKRLATRNMTLDQYKNKLKTEFLLNAVVENEIEPRIHIDPSELKTYYDKNNQAFLVEERVRASVILIKIDRNLGPKADQAARDRIQEILNEANKEGDFAELAKRHSQDSLAKKGGDLGYFTKKKMFKPFSERVFRMEVNTISKPFQTKHGFHIIKVTDKKMGGYLPFDKVSNKIRQILKKNRINTEREAYVEDLKKKSKVKIYF